MTKTLKLTLSKPPFEIMVTGEKGNEYRKPSDWIMSRLKWPDGTDKKYDRVQFTNGYGAKYPRFECVYLGYHIAKENYTIGPFSNGFIVEVERGDIIINLGQKL